MKGLVKSATLATTSIMFSLCLCELLVRIIAPQQLDNNPALYEPDDQVVFRMQPNHHSIFSNFEFDVPVSTNSMGFREKETSTKPPNTLRILGFGDSFTFGNGVTQEQTFLKQIERCLPSLDGLTTEVLNWGVPAYSLIQEYRLLETRGTELQPDIVIVGFFVGNDFVDSRDLYDSAGTPTIRVAEGELHSNKTADVERNIVRAVTQPFRNYLSTRSHLYVFLRNRSSELLSKFSLHAMNSPPEFCEAEFSPRMNESWKGIQAIFSNFSGDVRQHHQRLIVLILPTIYQVYETSWNQYIEALQLDPKRYDLDKPQRILREFLSQQNIEYVDVLPTLRSQTQGRPLFFPVDKHLTADGHRVVAQALCKYLSDKKTNELHQ